MSNFVIFTDSACDIKPAQLSMWGVLNIELSFRFDGEDREYLNSDMDIDEFYNRMKKGGIAKTSAINPEGFKAAFEDVLKEGKDILYIGFSSGLSTTCNSASIAADELSESYPDRKIIIIDTLAASAGQGMLVYFAVNKKNEGACLEETAEYVKGIAPNICHWFTVDDLVYLKRGGRVSPAVALVGKALGIKPIMHVDDNGKLIKISTIRGRRASIQALANKYIELAQNISEGTIFISCADCVSDAELLSDMIKEKGGAETKLITDVGTVIGAHSGPGTLALFFVGKER